MKFLHDLEKGVSLTASAIGRGAKQEIQRNIHTIGKDLHMVEKVGNEILKVAPIAGQITKTASQIANTVSVPLSIALPFAAPEILGATAGVNALSQGISSFNSHVKEAQSIKKGISRLSGRT